MVVGGMADSHHLSGQEVAEATEVNVHSKTTLGRGAAEFQNLSLESLGIQ